MHSVGTAEFIELPPSPTFGTLYRCIRSHRDRMQAELMGQKRPDPDLTWRVNELTRMMQQVRQAFEQAI